MSADNKLRRALLSRLNQCDQVRRGRQLNPDGTNLTPDLSAVENGLPSTDLPQGQKVYGPIAVDVPLGKAIAQIVLTNGLGGAQLGLWFS
jgi:hypothetical protein